MRRIFAAAVAVVLAAGLGLAVAPAASAATAPNNTSFVTALYNDYLGRQPGSGETGYWTAKLASGSPRTIVAVSFAGSDEYRLLRIDSAYRSILGREPEAAGRASWLDGMHRGLLGTDDVERSFYQSQEFYQRTGNTDDRWINGLYQQILGRDATFQETGYWLANGFRSHLVPPVNGGWASFDWSFDRGYVTTAIYGSLESARSRVTTMYSLYLGRTPDEAGIVLWADFDLRNGDAATRSGLTSSAEYYQLAAVRFP